MEKHKKRILGSIGLVLVAIMTLVAANIPPNSAFASSEDTTITVNVLPADQPVANIINPEDGWITTHSEVLVEATLANTDGGTFNLKKRKADGSYTLVSQEIVDNTFSGELDFFLDQDFGDYIIEAIPNPSPTGIPGIEDSISFRYVPAIAVVGCHAEHQDPVLDITTASIVSQIDVQAYHKTTGKPLFKEPIQKSVGMVAGQEDDTTSIVLPFVNAGADANEYRAEILAYKITSDIGEPELIPDFKLSLPLRSCRKSDAPAVPNTGSISIAGLNISRADYLISGLVIFLSVSIFALYLINRKKDHKARR